MALLNQATVRSVYLEDVL